MNSDFEDVEDDDVIGVSLEDPNVGPGKPPRERRFKPGQSGNPRGRPKRVLVPDKLLTEELYKLITVKTKHGLETMSRLEAIVMALVQKVHQGNPRAIRIYSDIQSKARIQRASAGHEPKQLTPILAWSDDDEEAFEAAFAAAEEEGLNLDE